MTSKMYDDIADYITHNQRGDDPVIMERNHHVIQSLRESAQILRSKGL